MNPVDLLPFLRGCCDISFNYLLKYITREQINIYLEYIEAPETTFGQALKFITQEHGHSIKIFNALESFSRISTMCEAVVNPSKEPISPESAFYKAYSALRAGIIITDIADKEERQALVALATHGMKFAESTGRKTDQLTSLLNNIVADHLKKKDRFPSYRVVLAELKNIQGTGLIEFVDEDGTIEWGKNGFTTLPALKKRLTMIKKNLPNR